MDIVKILTDLWNQTGFNDPALSWQQPVMLLVACLLVYLAIVKKYEPMLLLPIAFGAFVINIPGAHSVLYGTEGYILTDALSNQEVFRGTEEELLRFLSVSGSNVEYVLQNMFNDKLVNTVGIKTANLQEFAPDQLKLVGDTVIRDFGLFYYIYKGVDWVIFPPIIFLGIGAMTDFGPLLSNPKSLLLGAAAQIGIFFTLLGGLMLFNGPGYEQLAASVAIIGGADGPTAIYLASKLLGQTGQTQYIASIAIAAYSYMALIPVIQPPFMKLLTTKEERLIKMDALRSVSKTEKVVFPIFVTLICALIVPSSLPLLGMLMLGNLFKESGVVDRLSKTAQNELINIVTIFLGVMVGTKAYGPVFLDITTLIIVGLGLVAFIVATCSGVLIAKFMNLFIKKKINPLIGSAGVSAVPMAARVAQDVGAKEDPTNFLLMHAMGPNVAGVIGSAVAAGILLAIFGIAI